MFVLKRVVAKFGALGLKNGRFLLKNAFVIVAVLAFVGGIAVFTSNLGIGPSAKINRGNYNPENVAIAAELVSPDKARIDDFYNTYWIWMSRADDATTEDYRKEALDKATLAFNIAVKKDMVSGRTVDDVLSYFRTKGYIGEIKPDSGDLTEKVYNGGRPSIVFVYDGRTYPKGEASKRGAIVFKNLSHYFMKYHPGKVNFFVYDVSEAGDYVYKYGKWPKFGSEISNEFRKKGWKFDDLPNMLMYSPFDLVKGETPSVNDGVVELIDVLSGGPAEGLFTDDPMKRSANQFWIEFLNTYWLPENITAPNKVSVTRFKNSGSSKDIYY